MIVSRVGTSKISLHGITLLRKVSCKVGMLGGGRGMVMALHVVLLLGRRRLLLLLPFLLLALVVVVKGTFEAVDNARHRAEEVLGCRAQRVRYEAMKVAEMTSGPV